MAAGDWYLRQTMLLLFKLFIAVYHITLKYSTLQYYTLFAQKEYVILLEPPPSHIAQWTS
jgi:hypothetical protein